MSPQLYLAALEEQYVKIHYFYLNLISDPELLYRYILGQKIIYLNELTAKQRNQRVAYFRNPTFFLSCLTCTVYEHKYIPLNDFLKNLAGMSIRIHL
jgi:hypothetical protein